MTQVLLSPSQTFQKNGCSVIGVDASRAFSINRTGTENYSWHLLHALARHECQYLFRLYVMPNQVIPGWVRDAGFEVKVIDRDRYWTQWGLAKETWTDPVDLLFIPAHVIPFLKNPRVPVVVTVHDLRTEFLPQHSSWKQKFYLNQTIEWLRVKLARQIIAVSESTKQDLMKKLEVPDDKISVIYEGIDLQRFSLEIKDKKMKIEKIKRKYKIKSDYILFVGTIQPRKNLAYLIEAFSHLLSSIARISPISLILAGRKGWLCDDIYAAPDKFGVSESVQFIDYVDDQDLPYLYAGARLFAFPSLYEGFGLPILESLAVGTPVVTSDTSSMPEVGGDAVIYTDPQSVSSITEGLKRGLTEKFDQDKAQTQVAKFSWEQAARETVKVFDVVLHNTHRSEK